MPVLCYGSSDRIRARVNYCTVILDVWCPIVLIGFLTVAKSKEWSSRCVLVMLTEVQRVLLEVGCL
jgi:hypothetical protein